MSSSALLVSQKEQRHKPQRVKRRRQSSGQSPTPRTPRFDRESGFRALTTVAAMSILVLILALGGFLLWKALPAFAANTGNFFTEVRWLPDAAEPVFGVAALVFGTVTAATMSLLLAVPVSLGLALFLTHYAPVVVGKVLGFIIDLLAMVPSVIIGLWGLQVLTPGLSGTITWLNDTFWFIPIFANDQGNTSKSLFIAGVVLALMIIPTIAAISREVMAQVPRSNTEAALALGATKWETMRLAVLPESFSGIVSASMLGLGRALGETIAVALVLAATFDINWHLTEPGGNTFAANIALKWNEAGDIGLAALIASGLVLFVLTFVVNSAARLIARKHKARVAR